MSVEESCYEDDEDGNSLRVAKYFVGRLQLESKQMKKLSKDLIWFTLKKNLESCLRLMGKPLVKYTPTE